MTNMESQDVEKKPTTNLGRKLSRRLSIVAKVPWMINAKFKQDMFNGSNGSEHLSGIKSFDLICIAPDKTQRVLPCTRGQPIVEVITPILEEFSISLPKLYLGGSQALVQPEADCIYLYENVLIIEHRESTSQVDGITMNFYKLIEKIMNEESEFVKVLSSAAELYDNPTSTDTNSICELSIVFQSLNNLSAVCSGVVNELTSALFMENSWSLDIRCIFNDKLWTEYDDYLENYRTFKRIIRQKKSEDENFVNICRLRQGAAKYSLEQIVDFPNHDTRTMVLGFPFMISADKLANLITQKTGLPINIMIKITRDSDYEDDDISNAIQRLLIKYRNNDNGAGGSGEGEDAFMTDA